MRTDDIVKGEGMGDWNDRSSIRPGEDISSKRYTTLGIKPLLGKPPQTKRRMAMPLESHDTINQTGGSGQGLSMSNLPQNNFAQNGSMILNQSMANIATQHSPVNVTYDGLSNHDIDGSYVKKRNPRMNYN